MCVGWKQYSCTDLKCMYLFTRLGLSPCCHNADFQNYLNFLVKSVYVGGLSLCSFYQYAGINILCFHMSCRLLPTARCFPLRFHCLRALIRLSSKTDVYIPVASHLLEVLDSSSVHCRTKGSIAKPPNFSVILKVSKSQLQTRSYQVCVLHYAGATNACYLPVIRLTSHSYHFNVADIKGPILRRPCWHCAVLCPVL